MRPLHIKLILKSLKVAAILFLIFPKINAFGAVSGFVDSKQVNQNIPMKINLIILKWILIAIMIFLKKIQTMGYL